MKQTKIDWCDCTINPVVGCPRGCEYCYARIICKRFGKKWGVEDFSKPQFFPERLKQLKSKKSKSIFMNSMSDIAYWEQGYWRKTKDAICRYRHHNYIFLTKSLNIGLQNEAQYGNIFFGYTATSQKALDILQKNDNCVSETGFDFLNFEPILEPISLEWITDPIIKLIIIGAETGNRKGKIIPKKEWVESIAKQADERGIAVFMKGSLREIMGADFRQDKLIWEVSK